MLPIKLVPLLLPLGALATSQAFDVRKIIQALRQPHDDLTILCAHRGLRWNGTAENSREAYLRASEAGLECIETDIALSADGYLPMIHDGGLGRATDIGEQTGRLAYNPFTGESYNPRVKDFNFTGPNGIENLHLRDEQGRVTTEFVPSLPQMIESIHDSGANVVLQLDFKEIAAVEPVYWALKNLSNKAGVPANEWCIYKLQSTWYPTPEDFEALPWVQDAFASGIQLAFIPVYQISYEADLDQLASMRKFAATNYTISAQIGMRSTGGQLQNLLSETKSTANPIRTAGTFFAPGDLTYPNTGSATSFNTANYSLPADLHVHNSVYIFRDSRAPVLLDSLIDSKSAEKHNHRIDFNWIVEQGFDWVITDTADLCTRGCSVRASGI
jgi:glycerophosphoryl diester phosphodiesterase